MEKFQYSLHLLYEAQKDIPSDLLGRIQSLRNCIPAIQNIHITVVIPSFLPTDIPFKQDIPLMSVPPYPQPLSGLLPHESELVPCRFFKNNPVFPLNLL